MAVQRSLSKNLKLIRESRDLSQEKLSEISGVNYNTLIKLESGSSVNPTLNTLNNLCEALSVDIDTLVTDLGEIKDNFYDRYKYKDLEFNTRKDRIYENLVNFSQTRNTPVHRWFYYVEGYSPRLVENLFKYLDINNNSVVFDPFAGSGTSLYVAKQQGTKSYGFEINPFSAFAAKIKTRNYSKKELHDIKKFKLPRYKLIEDVYKKYELRIINKLFSKEKLSKIEHLKRHINFMDNEKARDLLMFALLSIVEDVSNYRKGGNGLKRKTVNKDLNPFIEFNNKLGEIVSDIDKVPRGKEPEIFNDSCLNIDNYDLDNFDISIFSPPYANCFDPFEVYKIELWIGDYAKSYENLRGMRKRALTSNLNANIKKEIKNTHRTPLLTDILHYLSQKDLWDKRIPKMLDTYFFEMYEVLSKIYKRSNKGAHCVIVVGNSAYGNLVVPTDLLLAEMGRNTGFEVVEIIEARRNETSSQQHKKLGKNLEFMRESIVILQK